MYERIMNKIKETTKFKKYIYITICIMLYLILIHLLFFNLGDANISSYDEARHGVNAYEMINSNNYVVTKYGYKNDYWNLKPPISEYVILLGYKIYGFNSVGLRFGSAFAMLACATICYIFSLKKIGKIASIWTLIGFIIAEPLIFKHCARTGDADSLFVLFSTVAIIGLLVNNEKMKGFYIACFSFSLAFLTKSWHAGNIAILIIIYFLLNIRKLKINLKKTIIGLFFALMPILIWGIARYINDGTKFFWEMIRFDLLKRTSNTLEGHVGNYLFYFNYLLKFKVLLIFIGVSSIFNFFGAFKKNQTKKNKNILILILSIIIPLTIFTFAKTKINWYILCVFPSFILLSAYGAEKLHKSSIPIKKIIFLVLIIIATILVKKNIKKVNGIKTNEKDYTSYVFNLLKRDQVYSNKKIYIYTKQKMQNWEQKELLATELAGDMICINGGYEKWKNDLDAYIIVSQFTICNLKEQVEVVSYFNVKYDYLYKTYYLVKHKTENNENFNNI